MGCCGCDNRSSVNTAGVFAILQSIVGFALAAYNLSVFYGDIGLYGKEYLFSVLYSDKSVIRGLLFVLIFVYAIWIISSIILLVGNSNNRSGQIRQWVVISTIIILLDIILPAILMGVTIGEITESFTRTSSYSGYYGYTYVYTGDNNLLSNYAVLLLAFSRGGLVTWICDIALTVYASRRAHEIDHPPAVYIYAQPQPNQIFIAGQQPQYLQQGFAPQWSSNQFQQSGASQYAAPPPSYSTLDKSAY